MLEVFHLSYYEPFADETYEKLKERVPWAKRVAGVKGIFWGHKECAKQSLTTMFYVVDADAILEDDFNFTYITKPKISGACLVLSSDLIKFGVNIPLCLLYNDDEGLSIMCEKLLGQNFVQFVCKNILHVHARRHPRKRLYIKDEDNPYSFIGNKNSRFQELLNLSKHNIQNLIAGTNRFYEYNDLKNILENK